MQLLRRMIIKTMWQHGKGRRDITLNEIVELQTVPEVLSQLCSKWIRSRDSNR